MTRHFEPIQLAVIWMRLVGAGLLAVGGGLVLLALAAISAGRIAGALEWDQDAGEPGSVQ